VHPVLDVPEKDLLEDMSESQTVSKGGPQASSNSKFEFDPITLAKRQGPQLAKDRKRISQRAVACHDLGYARDEDGRLIFDNPDLSLWGRGYRLDEIRGAVLRVQLKKMPSIVERMRTSKYRIRQALEKLPGLKLRRIVDPAGDTVAFLITTYENAATGQRVNKALRAEGITAYPQGLSNIRMTDWGLHLYYNIVSLTRRSVDGSGFPWNLTENAGSEMRYQMGTCPKADDLFERSIIMSIPSCLSTQDEEDTIHAFHKVVPYFCGKAKVRAAL
jgi:8-amino-3,8-dideoxy-alpha-D-manno-octulosonate transaminase